MALKLVVDTIEAVEENFRNLYEKGPDGKFSLMVDGAVPKDKLDEFRNNNIELKKQLEKFKDVDPAKYQEAMKTLKALEEKKLVDAGNLDEVIAQRVAELNQEHKTALEERDAKLTLANRQLEHLMIDTTAKSAAAQNGVISFALDDVVLRAKTVFKVVDGSVVATEGGKQLYDKDGMTPLTIDSWVKGLKKSAPHLFSLPVGGGAGGSGRTLDRSKMSSIDKIKAGLEAN